MKIQDHPLWDVLDFIEQCIVESYVGNQEFATQEELEEAIVEALNE